MMPISARCCFHVRKKRAVRALFSAVVKHNHKAIVPSRPNPGEKNSPPLAPARWPSRSVLSVVPSAKIPRIQVCSHHQQHAPDFSRPRKFISH